MNLIQTLITALRELSMRKFRSALAALGVIFGVASVMAMLSIGEGAKRQTLERIAILGLDNLIIRTVKPPKQSSQQQSEQSGREEFRYGLRRQDLEHIRATFAGVKFAVGTRDARKEIRPGGGRSAVNVKVLAVEPDYLQVTRSKVERGRFVLASDGTERRACCVIGVDAARRVFGFADPMGQDVRVGNDWYQVVGLLRNAAGLKEAGGDDINNCVFISLGTAQARSGDMSLDRTGIGYEMSVVELDSISVQLSDESTVEATAARMAMYLERSHTRKDYEMLIPRELMKQKEATQRIFTVVMASIASISLLVGGIGIMNIMLANVSDRRREIGTRRALGARRIDIVWQFIFEASALTTLGGLVGVGIGYLLARGISRGADWPVVVTPESIVLGLAVSAFSGVVFGLWPAWQAARVNPIEALRAL